MIGDRNRKNGTLSHYSHKITITVKLTHDEVRSKLYSSKKKTQGAKLFDNRKFNISLKIAEGSPGKIRCK